MIFTTQEGASNKTVFMDVLYRENNFTLAYSMCLHMRVINSQTIHLPQVI